MDVAKETHPEAVEERERRREVLRKVDRDRCGALVWLEQRAEAMHLEDVARLVAAAPESAPVAASG